MKKSKHPLIVGTFLLTLAGLISRAIGFFYKIFLASLIGAEGIGIYQMVFPIYILCVSLASSGIQTAISRFTAEKLSTGYLKDARNLFYTGLIMSLCAALTLSALLFLFAEPLAHYLLREERCFPLLRLMALAIPFETIHTCANGYFFGQQKTGFPAISQLLEQTVRVGSTFLFYLIVLQESLEPSPLLAAAGLLTAEITAAMATITVLAFQKKLKTSSVMPSISALSQNIRCILNMALPITSNRLLLNLLQSGEAIMIPLQLQQYYGDASTALSVYGIFSGMALSLITFPCIITSSLSMVLLPSVSEARALKNDKKIAATIQSSLLLCIFLGVTFTGAFLIFGSSLGLLLFGNDQVGSYLTTLAWICPFLYLNTTNNSILNGLGKTMTVFLHSMAGLLIRLLFSWLLIPRFGISGCLWGLLASQLVSSFFGILTLKRTVSFTIHPGSLILFPCGCCLAATGFLRFLQCLLPVLQLTDKWIPFLLSGGIWGITVFGLYGGIGKQFYQGHS